MRIRVLLQFQFHDVLLVGDALAHHLVLVLVQDAPLALDGALLPVQVRLQFLHLLFQFLQLRLLLVQLRPASEQAF